MMGSRQVYGPSTVITARCPMGRFSDSAPTSCTIPVPTTLNARSFEDLLRAYLPESLRRQHCTIDMRATRYCSTFQLSLLLIWIHRITSNKNRQVIIVPPGGNDKSEDIDLSTGPILRYLGQWRFWDALKRVNAATEVSDRQKHFRQGDEDQDLSERYIPFEFYSSKLNYDQHLAGLREDNLKELFGDSASLDVIGSGGLRSIILEELGKNAFEHGAGVAAHIAIGKMPAVRAGSQEEIQEKIAKRALAVPAYAQSFFTTLGAASCLEVVVSDRGPGIPATIRRAYHNDTIIPNRKNEPTQEELIRYAFLLHSSSKDDSWYGRSESHGAAEYVPPRGLFFVKNIARRNHALLVCRSDRAVVSWDFLTSSEGLVSGHLAEKARGRHKAIMPLGGTQLQMLIPCEVPTSRTSIGVHLPEGFGQETDVDDVEIIPVARILRDKASDTAQSIARTVVRMAHTFVLKQGRNHVFVFDFLGTSWTKDSLYPVVCELGHMGLDNCIVAVIHTAHFDAVLDEMIVDAPSGDVSLRYVHRYRPFLRLNWELSSLTISLVGLPEKGSAEIEEAIAGLRNDHHLRRIPEVLDHLFCTAGDDTLVPRFSRNTLEVKLQNWRSAVLKQYITQPEYHIFHSGKFLLPTAVYVEGFYELGALFAFADGVALLSETLATAYATIHENRTLLFCVSKIGGQVGRLLHDNTAFAGEVDQTTLDDTLRAGIHRFDASAHSQIVVVVDVIATGQSLALVLNFLRGRFPDKPLRVLTVLDIRPIGMPNDRFDTDTTSFALRSLYRFPKYLYREKPHAWPYKDIRRIDRVAWRPITQDAHVGELWDSRSFLAVACMESDAIRIGHYRADNGNHYRFFFVTPRLVAKYSDDIVGRIREKVESILQKRSQGCVTHILFPQDTLGISSIVQRLQVHFGGVSVLPVERGGDARIYASRKQQVDTVIILDSACSSNRTISYLMDVAAEMGAACTIVCVMMSRAHSQTWRFVNRITGYSHHDVDVSALTRIEIPVFSSESSCPLCQRRRVLEGILANNRHLALAPAIERELDRLQPKHIRQFISDTTVKECLFDPGEVAYFRLLIEKQRTNTSALTELDAIIKTSDASSQRRREHLLLACSDETSYVFSDELGLPQDLRSPFACMAAGFAITSATVPVLRTALQVVSAAGPEMLHETIIDSVRQHVNSLESIEAILLELLIHHETRPHHDTTAIVSLFDRMRSEVESLAHHRKVQSDILPLISRVSRSMACDVATQGARTENARDMFLRVARVCRRKKGGTHPFLGECLTKISMLSTAAYASPILEKYYFGEDAFADTMLRELLPGISAMGQLITALDDDATKYLRDDARPSLRTDFWLVDDALVRLLAVSRAGTLTDDDLNRRLSDREVREALTRLTDWLGQADSGLGRTMKSLVCDLLPTTNEIWNYWRPAFEKKGVVFKYVPPANAIKVFGAARILVSVSDSLLRNCYKYAFEGFKRAGARGPIVMFRVTEGEDDVTITTADNGVGLRSETDAGLGRIREIGEVFGGSADIVEIPDYSLAIRTIWKKGGV